VAQEEVTSKSGFWTDNARYYPTAKYDLKITHNIPDNAVLKVQDTINVEIKIINTNPVTNLEFDISEILGDLDAISFGKPSVVFGDAYRHDETLDSGEQEGKLVHLEPVRSSSGLMQSWSRAIYPPSRSHRAEAALEDPGTPQHGGHQGHQQC
jgi:hypothetical protein